MSLNWGDHSVICQERVEHVILDEERERQERNHERFADILDQLERRTEELQMIQQLIEFRLREIEEEADRVRSARLVRHSGDPTDTEGKLHESLIRSAAYGKCTICLDEEPMDPVGCIYCQQLVGCRRVSELQRAEGFSSLQLRTFIASEGALPLKLIALRKCAAVSGNFPILFSDISASAILGFEESYLCSFGCVNRWYLLARFGETNHGQCPLCRHEWLDQAEVMGIFFLKNDI